MPKNSINSRLTLRLNLKTDYIFAILISHKKAKGNYIIILLN